MIIEQERLDAMKEALLQFADTIMTARQAEQIAKFLVQTDADPIIAELKNQARLHRSEFEAQLQIIKRKNTDNMNLTNQIVAAGRQITNLQAALKRK